VSGELRGVLALDEAGEPVVLSKWADPAYGQIAGYLDKDSLREYVDSLMESGASVLAMESMRVSGDLGHFVTFAGRFLYQGTDEQGRFYFAYRRHFALILARWKSWKELTFYCYKGSGEPKRCVALPLRGLSFFENVDRLAEVVISVFERGFTRSESRVVRGLLQPGEALLATGSFEERDYVFESLKKAGFKSVREYERVGFESAGLHAVDPGVFKHFETDLYLLGGLL